MISTGPQPMSENRRAQDTSGAKIWDAEAAVVVVARAEVVLALAWVASFSEEGTRP